LGRFLDLPEVASLVLIEVFQAGLAAELYLLSVNVEGMRLHVALFIDFLAGDDARLQWIGFRLVVSVFVVVAGVQDSGGQAGEQNRSEDVFRELHSVAFVAIVYPFVRLFAVTTTAEIVCVRPRP
jgi:hypothetical protein